MNRYAMPLVLTVTLYGAVTATLLFSLDDTNEIAQQKKSEQRVAFTIISQPKIVQPKIEKQVRVEEKVQEIVKQKPKKTVPEKIVKKVEKPKIVKKVEPKKRVVKKEKIVTPKKEELVVAQKKEIVPPKKEKSIEPAQVVALPTPEPQIQQSTQALQNKLNVEAEKNRHLEEQKNLYFSKIKGCIAENKVYPRIARKRGIEDSVKVKFVISKDGEFIAFTSIDCKSIFKKSVEKAIVSTFPLKPQSGLFDENINISLTINYRLL